MEDAAGTLAREGEHILWSGMAEDYDPFADDMRKATIRRFAICFGTAVLLDLFYIVATIASGTGEFHLLMPLVVLLVAGIIAWSPFTDRSLVLQNAAYFLTDTSIVVATEGVHFASLPLKTTPCEVVPSAAGNINVLFGTAAKARERDYPRNGYTPEKDRQTSEITGLEFFNIKDTPELRAALKKN